MNITKRQPDSVGETSWGAPSPTKPRGNTGKVSRRLLRERVTQENKKVKINSTPPLKTLLSILVSASLFFCSFGSLAGDLARDDVDNYASAFWDSFNNDLAKGELETYLKHWDANAERITPTAHARGVDEIRAVYQSYLEIYSDFHQQEIRRIIDGQTVVSELITTAINKASGEKMTLPNVAIVELNKSGKVIRARVYLDTRIFNP